MTKTPTWKSWCELKQRCLNPRNHAFPRYGGRGITICDRWLESFANFLADMGERPFPHTSIDRIDNNGPYSPKNCRWATKSQQARNRKTTRWVTYEGRRMSLAQLAQELGLKPSTLWMRLYHYHTNPVQERHPRPLTQTVVI